MSGKNYLSTMGSMGRSSIMIPKEEGNLEDATRESPGHREDVERR